MTTTSGRVDRTRWDEEIYDAAEGAKLQTVFMAKAFAGGIDATSTGRLLQAFAAMGPPLPMANTPIPSTTPSPNGEPSREEGLQHAMSRWTFRHSHHGP